MKKLLHEKFDSISSMITALNSRPVNKVFEGKHLSSTKGSYDFTGTHSYEEACQLCLNGWDEKLNDIKAQFTKATKSNSNGAIAKRRTYNHVVGYAPNVPNAILGLPKSMITTGQQAQKVKVARIIYSPTGLCDVTAYELTKSGIVVLNIVNQLELNGIRVNLIIEPKASSCNNQDTSMMIEVKSYRDPLDLRKIAFPIAHPSIFRRLAFRWIETVPGLTDYGYNEGYGHTISDKEYHRQDLINNGLMKDSDYYLSHYLIDSCHYDTDAVMARAGIKVQ